MARTGLDRRGCVPVTGLVIRGVGAVVVVRKRARRRGRRIQDGASLRGFSSREAPHMVCGVVLTRPSRSGVRTLLSAWIALQLGVQDGWA